MLIVMHAKLDRQRLCWRNAQKAQRTSLYRIEICLMQIYGFEITRSNKFI